jgi:hypothetical protein
VTACAALALAATLVRPRAAAAEDTVAAERPVAAATPAPPAEPAMSSPGLVAGGVALGVVGLGSTGLGVFLTLKGSTLDCISCAGSSDDAPLVAGGLTAIVLGIGMAATGGTMVVLGMRDEAMGIRVRTEVRAGLDGVALHGSF